jgi:hypothetical protein
MQTSQRAAKAQRQHDDEGTTMCRLSCADADPVNAPSRVCARGERACGFGTRGPAISEERSWRAIREGGAKSARPRAR